MSLMEREGAKTKIIATIGDPQPIKDELGNTISPFGTHKNGVYDTDRRQLRHVSIESLVEIFIRNHADLIRMNVAHHHTRAVVDDFLELKKAILKVERRLSPLLGARRIGVLIDLPGPKIRFQNKFRLPDEYLTILFNEGEPVPEDSDGGTGLLSPAKERSVRINLGERPFATAAPDATRRILAEVRTCLSGAAKLPLLAFIGDTECTLEVLHAGDDSLRCRVVHDGTKGKALSDRKGFTIRGIKKPIAAFTKEDDEKLKLLLAADAQSADRVLTHVGISFCQDPDDVRRAMNCMLLHANGGKVPKDISAATLELPDLIAKIETQEGLNNIERILDFADGVMVARGDLALEMETVAVPAAAKRIIRSANVRGKTVIMATQMLESMQSNLECSRPEAFDVFNAVVDGVDALMLSGETSSGKYPGLAIQKMRALATEAEKYMSDLDREYSHIDRYYREFTNPAGRAAINDRWERLLVHNRVELAKHHIPAVEAQIVDELLTLKQERLNEQDSTDRITHSACTMAADADVTAVVAPTKSGRTVRMLARFRPPNIIFAEPHSAYIARKLSIVWGTVVTGIIPSRKGMEVSELMEASWKLLPDLHGSAVVFICGTPIGQVGTSNILSRTIVGSVQVAKAARARRKRPVARTAKPVKPKKKRRASRK